MSLKHALLARMPHFVQDRVVLRQLRVDDEAVRDVVIKVAETSAEHDAAARLTFEAYAARNLVDSSGVPVRATPFLMLPSTVRFVALKGHDVVATLALFQESQLGLPMGEVFSNELAGLRQQGRRLAEIGALAIEKAHRRTGLAMLIYKAMWQTAVGALGIDDFVVAVHPEAEPMYRAPLRFVRLTDTVRRYKGLQSGALACALRLNLTTMKTVWRTDFARLPADCFNPYRFFYETEHTQIRVPTVPHALASYRLAARQAALRLASLRPEMLMSMQKREFELLQAELASATDEMRPQ